MLWKKIFLGILCGLAITFVVVIAVKTAPPISTGPVVVPPSESSYEYTQDDLNWMVEECVRMGNAVVLTKVNYNDKPTVLPLCVDLETWIGRK